MTDSDFTIGFKQGQEHGIQIMQEKIEDIKQEIENYMISEGFGSGWIEDIKEIINKHITEEK